MKCFVIGICLLISQSLFSQKLPKWYLDLVSSKVGEWVADNSNYVSDSESTKFYSLQWWKGIDGTDLHGVLKDDNERVIWSYYQYYDQAKGRAIVNQMGLDGAIGKGELSYRSDTLVLLQVFESKEDLNWKELHYTLSTEANKEKTISFTIDENGRKTEGRSYEWEKEEYIKL